MLKLFLTYVSKPMKHEKNSAPFAGLQPFLVCADSCWEKGDNLPLYL